MYWLRGPWGLAEVLQLTYELRPKVGPTTRQDHCQNAVSRSDPRYGSDKKHPVYCWSPQLLLLLNYLILQLFGPPKCLLSSNHGRRNFRFLGLGKGTSMFYTPDIEKYSCTWIALCFYTQTPALTPKNHSATLPQLSSYERVWLLSQCDPAVTRQHPEHKRQFSWRSGW